MPNFGNAPAGRNVDSITYFAHIPGGLAGLSATGLIEGAVVVNPMDGSIDDNQAVLPTAAGAKGVLGVVTDSYGAEGPVEGRPTSVRYLGLVGVNVMAGVAVNFGDKLITANAFGDVKPRTVEHDVDVVAIAHETIAPQSARTRALARMQIQYLP